VFIVMHKLITILLITNMICISNAVSAQVNYDLFPGHGEIRGYPMKVNYRAWVISYRQNKYYNCFASYDFATPMTPTLTCSVGGSFNPPLLSGNNVKTVQALGSPRGGPESDEAQSGFFWQIDQDAGRVQFCMPVLRVNCVAFQIPSDSESSELSRPGPAK
jgi:hypothetical protein